MNTKMQTSAWQKVLALVFAMAAAFSLAGVLSVAPASLQAAYAEEASTLTLNSANLTDISAEDGDAYAYYLKVDSPYTTIDFSNVIGGMTDEYSMIAVINGNHYVGGTTEATIANYSVSEDDLEDIGEYLNADAISGYDFSKDTYVFWITDDDAEMYYFILQMPGSDEPEDVDQTFSVTANGEKCRIITKAENAYEYYDFNAGKTSTVPLYTVVVPEGTTSVDLALEKPRLIYNYEDGTYLAGWVEDATKGATSATVNVDFNKNGVMDAIQIQRPYIKQGEAWLDGTLLYAITFAYPDTNQAFTVSANGTACSGVVKTENAYEYYDFNAGKTCTVPLYAVAVPEGTTSVDLALEKPRLIYNYEDGTYLAGGVDDPSKGATSATVSVDFNENGVMDTIQIQRPYFVDGSDWLDGTLLYAITFKTIKPIGSAAFAKTTVPYNGKAQTPTITVKDEKGNVLTKDTDYTVAYKNNVNAGTATVTVTGKTFYAGTITKTFTITKATQKVTAKKTTVTKKYKAKKSKLASKKTIKSAKSTFGLSAETGMTFKKTSGNKKITVSKSGKITIKKGLKKGTYKVKIKVSASSSNYEPATKTITLKVKVK